MCGHRMGTVDLRSLRKHVGLVTTRQRLPDEEGLTVEAVVLSGHTGTILPLWRYYDDQVRAAAREWLELVGCAELAQRTVRDCSQGERARVRLARALLADPAVLLLDEPFAGLDLPGREDLLLALEGLVRARPTMTTVLVTHHVEEVPATTTHALMLKDGGVVTAAPMEVAFTGANLGRCLGRELELVRIGSRWTAHAMAPGRSTV